MSDERVRPAASRWLKAGMAALLLVVVLTGALVTGSQPAQSVVTDSQITDLQTRVGVLEKRAKRLRYEVNVLTKTMIDLLVQLDKDLG